MKLYELAADYETAFGALVDPETGEMAENALMILDSLQTDIKDKGLAVATYIKNIDADAEALEAEEKRMAARRKAIVSRKEWLKSYLRTNMEACGISEISSPYFSVKLKKCPPSVHVFEEDMVPSDYFKEKTTVSLDKIKMKQDIQAGIVIPGAELVQGNTVTIK